MNATIAHVSATTATTNATMTQVPATRSATTNAPKYQLDKCNATQAQNKMMSLRILHPVKMMANHAIPKYLLLFFCLKQSSNYNFKSFADSHQRRPSNYNSNKCQFLTSVDC
jgi:hypothetical protein